MPVGVGNPVLASATLAAKVIVPLGVTLVAEAAAVAVEAEPTEGSA